MAAVARSPGLPVKITPLGAYAAFFLFFIYAPVLLLPLFSFNDSQYVALPLNNFTTRWYEEMFAAEQLQGALMNSLKVATVVSIVATTLATLAALALTRYRVPGRAVISGTIVLPLVIPGIILGVSILVVMVQVLGVTPSLWSIGAGHLLICTPFGMLILISRLEGFDRSLEEASLDLGETRFVTFFRVTLPLALPGVIASILTTFTLSFDEFILAFFLAGVEPTLPVYIWSQLRFPQRLPQVLALGSIILVVSFAVIAFAEWYRRSGVQPDAKPA
ncbi:MAG: ABC transporter permease [Rhodospirillales bacterium]